MAVSIVPTAIDIVTASTANPITFTSKATGTAAADRYSVVSVNTRDGRSVPNGVTINGITATVVGQLSLPAVNMYLSIWSAANPSGTTGNVVLTWGSATAIGCGISVYAVYGAEAIVLAQGTSSNTVGTTTISLGGLMIPTDSGAIYCAQNGDQTNTATWTNATESEDQNAGNSRSGSAYTTTAGTPTITYASDVATTNPYGILGVVFVPLGYVLPATPIYFSSASIPAVDGGTSASGTVTITPPASMNAGDLVIVICESRASATWSIGVTGGQTWTSETAFSGTAGPYLRIFWCQYNGTWSASPRFDSTSATSTTAVMHVFRSGVPANTWAIDVAQATATFTGTASPVRTGLTTVHADALTLAVWASLDDNTWSSLSGTGWGVTGLAQYRNASGTGQVVAFAHHLDAAASATVPNVTYTQSGTDAGASAIIAWYSVPAAGPSAFPAHHYQQLMAA